MVSILENLRVTPRENLALLTAWICTWKRVRKDTWEGYLGLLVGLYPLCVCGKFVSLLWDPMYLSGMPVPPPLPGYNSDLENVTAGKYLTIT